MEEFRFEITEVDEGDRIDKFLTENIDFVSRSYIQKIIKDGKVSVNDKIVKPSFVLKTDDQIYFQLPDSIEPNIEAENLPLDIIYEDSDLIIINKPKNMVVHPANGHYSGTLVNALMYHCKNDLSGINGVLRPGIVHRIDKNTSGSLIVCKNDKTSQ